MISLHNAVALALARLSCYRQAVMHVVECCKKRTSSVMMPPVAFGKRTHAGVRLLSGTEYHILVLI